MKVTLRSVLHSSYDVTVENVKKSSLLHFIAFPFVVFSPINAQFPTQWVSGIYWTRISLFGFLPFPKQAIVISYPENGDEFILRDNGYSPLIKTWDHLITISKKSENEVFYQDTIEIKAGVMTPLIWVFALCFYSYRQYRLRKLAKNKFRDINP